MVFTHPTNIVMCRKQTYNLTHFVCIPLVTASSRPLLRNSLGLLRDNPASAKIPSGAFIPIDTLHLSLGFAMSLPTTGRITEANKLLQSLDLNSLTRQLSKPSLRERSIKEISSDVERSLSLSSGAPMAQSLPLHVTLSGLVAAQLEGQNIMAETLLAHCYDPTYQVNHLCNNLAIIFAAAGLFDPSTQHQFRRTKLRKMGLPLPKVSLMKTSRPTYHVPSRNQPGKMEGDRSPTIDSRDLVRIFKDFVWADNIRLERLSICSLGITEQIRQLGSDARLSEACSVSLL